MCDFERLAFTQHGYIVRCTECGHYQLGFGTSMLTISGEEFSTLFKTAHRRLYNVAEIEAISFSEETKNVVITTPVTGMCFILTRKELQQLYELLDKADNEIKALSLMELFK